MSLILATAFAASLTVTPTCSWDRPGHDPFIGDVVQAVDRYDDIPKPVRERLKQRMARRDFDELVSIERERIVGKRRYAPTIRDMHFGPGRLCRTVTRERWTPSMLERGLVYCEGVHCILVPTACRNVSRVDPLPEPPAASASVVALAEPEELELDSTPAGAPLPDDVESFEQRAADPYPPVEPRLDPPSIWPPVVPPPIVPPRPPWVPPHAVPEPPSTMLMLAGFAAVIGFLNARRR